MESWLAPRKAQIVWDHIKAPWKNGVSQSKIHKGPPKAGSEYLCEDNEKESLIIAIAKSAQRHIIQFFIL